MLILHLRRLPHTLREPLRHITPQYGPQYLLSRQLLSRSGHNPSFPITSRTHVVVPCESKYTARRSLSSVAVIVIVETPGCDGLRLRIASRLFSRPTRSMFLFEPMCDTVFCVYPVSVTFRSARSVPSVCLIQKPEESLKRNLEYIFATDRDARESRSLESFASTSISVTP